MNGCCFSWLFPISWKLGLNTKPTVSQTNAVPYSNNNLFKLHNPQGAELAHLDSCMGSYLPDAGSFILAFKVCILWWVTYGNADFWSCMHSCKLCSMYLCLLIPCLTTIEHCSILVVMVGQLTPIFFKNCWVNRIAYKDGHITDACTLNILDLLCSPYKPAQHSDHSAGLWTEISSTSPGFKKYQPRCLNLNVAKATQSQRTCAAISDGCLHLPHSGLFTSPSLFRCLFKWQCPVNSPVIIHSWFLE
jgi:hypothetical protein